ncbi:MAG TPA: carboxypeptidase regulatory-like domain-containing protein [Thermoanaerobaculia bacterium]|nr:carboxypeptidase regulatory-like domain-containing protein [Thermoanaerobaculia bacterium]
MRIRLFAVLLACWALAAPLAYAQTNKGEIWGVVQDGQGGPLPGVTVTITGPQLPAGRFVTTLSDGVFRFKDLPPATYHLKAELTGMGQFDQDVVVASLSTTEVRPVLRATARESVEVTAATPLVDTKSSDVSATTTKDTIEKLPLTRTFTGTFQLAPGVAENNASTGSPNAGGGKQDNTYFYDGVNITNPFFGDLFQNFAELDLQEVNITRGGVTAEYGRTGGFIVNGVTKSGSNNLHGEARLEYQPSGAAAKSKDPTITSQFDIFRPGADVGGPIIRDHLFGYGSINFLRQNETDRVNTLGNVPDNHTHVDEYFGKLTANPTSSVLLDGSFRYRSIDADNAGIGNFTAPSAAGLPKTIDRVIVASGYWTASPKLSFEVRFNHNEDNNSVSALNPIAFKQAPFNAAAPYLSGTFVTGHSTTNGKDYIFAPANRIGQSIGSGAGSSDLAPNDQNFFRDEYRIQGSYLTGVLGASHDIRAGFTFSKNREDLNRASNGWGTITISDSSNCGPVSARPCYRARFTPPFQQISRGNTYGIFVQDQATWKSVTVNVGVLVNEDYYTPNDNGSFTFIRGNPATPGNAAAIPACSVNSTGPACTYQSRINIPWSKQWQPRIGVSWEINQAVHDKLYANAARYDNMDNQSIARAAAPFRALRVDDYINLTTGSLITEVVRANQTNKLVIPNIDPTYTDEGIIGYARPLGDGWSAEIYGMYRHSTDIIEDFTITHDGSNFRYGNIPADRYYRAATIQVRKAYGSNWTMDASYTLSRLGGNWDLDTSGNAIFYSSSYIGDGPGLFPTDPFHNGILQGDREHIAKLFGTYTFKTQTTLGGYLRFQSGQPWEARGFDPVNGTDLMPIEEVGSRRNASWTNFDLLVAQNIPLGPGNLRLEGRLLNVFNSQPALTVNRDWCKNSPCDSITGIPASNLNPLFGTPTTYAPPRRFLVSAIFSY